MLYIESLYHSLQMAVDKRIIREWTVEGHNVVITKGSVNLPVPVLEASNYLTELFVESEQNEVEKTALASGCEN